MWVIDANIYIYFIFYIFGKYEFGWKKRWEVQSYNYGLEKEPMSQKLVKQLHREVIHSKVN